ncbi:MAG: MucR family transcriptional regulator [Phenylobacterium sp.]|uniref:MucR family transcriptional regulator n=1 Tax=Phenylobacterium sp. TaxID=1871053 RepID=UPI0027369B7F|nr:MucR family transcriptional regulator [Phenylobacterium sp.]MDP3745647.1 MucR family transcriptional regulator [Phenylobacterium sp.]
MDTNDTQVSARLAADVLIAYLRRNTIPAAELPDLARLLRDAFADEGPAPIPERISQHGQVQGEVADAGSASKPAAGDTPSHEESKPPTPAVAIDDSIHDDYLISLEDGKHYRSLRRHLMAKYGMTPEDYRTKWGLRPDYPMVAPSYARDRSEVAKRSGLGHSPARKGARTPRHA